MSAHKAKKRSKLRSKYRFSIYNDTSHNELFVFRNSGLGMIVSLILAVILIITSVTILIAFTPLRELIPGYPDTHTRQMIVSNALKADSLEQVVEKWEWQLSNIQQVLSGKDPIDLESMLAIPAEDSTENNPKGKTKRSRTDSLLREDILKQEQFSVSSQRGALQQIEGTLFFPPVKGIVSDGFNAARKHFAIDIAAPENSVVSSVLDGTVIMAGWTDDTGFVIHIQHNNNLVSIYKHNAKLLKKAGDRVKAGAAIALVGNSGTLTTGTHLHFELWHNGVPIDPAKYISF